MYSKIPPSGEIKSLRCINGIGNAVVLKLFTGDLGTPPSLEVKIKDKNFSNILQKSFIQRQDINRVISLLEEFAATYDGWNDCNSEYDNDYMEDPQP